MLPASIRERWQRGKTDTSPVDNGMKRVEKGLNVAAALTHHHLFSRPSKATSRSVMLSLCNKGNDNYIYQANIPDTAISHDPGLAPTESSAFELLWLWCESR